MENQNTKLLWKLKIPSKSEPGTFHIVEIYTNGEMRCDCFAAEMKKVCHHIRKVRNFIERLSDKVLEKYPLDKYPTKPQVIVKKVIPKGESPAR